ncbi:hypothetical protein AAEX28_01360 [Lentisphaerota bacterium WC36G]|nr:hypothetical protein LJT99_04245 [Lentisphaerae bacterium WC36]
MNQFYKKLVWTLLLIIFSALLFLIGNIKVPYIDASSNKYFSSSIKKATASYAVCKMTNASVSVLKESYISVHLGIGGNVALGEILDPIDDITERASNLMITAIASLGIQKIIYEITCFLAPKIIALLLIFLTFGVWVNSLKNHRSYAFTKKIIVVLLLARFCLPASSYLSNFIEQQFFEFKITQTNKKIKILLPDYKQKNSYFTKAGFNEIKEKVQLVYSNLTAITESYLALITLYLGLFIVQIILIPLVMLFLFIKITKNYFNKDFEDKFKQLLSKKRYQKAQLSN